MPPCVASAEEVLKEKDFSRTVLAVHALFDPANGERWLLTDWWDLASAWGEEGKQGKWVRELMDGTWVRALRRMPEFIGRAMNSREFWGTFELGPVKGRLGENP